MGKRGMKEVQSLEGIYVVKSEWLAGAWFCKLFYALCWALLLMSLCI